MLRSQQLSISSSVTAYFDIFGHDKREMMMEGGWVGGWKSCCQLAYTC